MCVFFFEKGVKGKFRVANANTAHDEDMLPSALVSGLCCALLWCGLVRSAAGQWPAVCDIISCIKGHTQDIRKPVSKQAIGENCPQLELGGDDDEDDE